MKRLFILIPACVLALGACTATQYTSGTDDVYADPVEERQLARQAAEQKARAEAAARAEREQETALAAKKEEENSQYYKDPEYNSEDYYDYEYASRINRFHRPLPGAGYYDPYYTNMYTYNQNPAFWGTSIYSGWGMPSQQFGMYSWGISTGWGYPRYSMGWGYGSMCSPWYDPWYDPWCYRGFNSWNYGYGYSAGYWNGYHNGYYNGLYNGYWGYYNRYDANSNYGYVNAGPRQSAVGGNVRSGRSGSESARMGEQNRSSREYIQSVSEEQNRTQRFERRAPSRLYEQGNSQNRSQPSGNQSNQGNNRNQPGRLYESVPREQRNQNTQQQQRRVEPQRQQNDRSWSPSNNRNSGSGGGMSPRNSGGNSRSGRR